MAQEATISNGNNILAEWTTPHVTILYTLGDLQLIAKLLLSPDKTAVLLDVRRYKKTRPTTEGVALFIYEVEWLKNMIQKRLEGSYEGKRKVYLTRIWSGIRIMVLKSKGNTKEIVLTGLAYNKFASELGSLYSIMDNYCKEHALMYKDTKTKITCEATPWYDDERVTDDYTEMTDDTPTNE